MGEEREGRKRKRERERRRKRKPKPGLEFSPLMLHGGVMVGDWN